MRNINRLKKLEEKLIKEKNHEELCIAQLDNNMDQDLQIDLHVATCTQKVHYFIPKFAHDE